MALLHVHSEMKRNSLNGEMFMINKNNVELFMIQKQKLLLKCS